MFNFSNYESFVNESDINNLQTNLDAYETNMDNLINGETGLENDYTTSVYNTSSPNNSVNQYNSSLNDLSGINTNVDFAADGIDIPSMQTQYTTMKDKIGVYNSKKDTLEKRLVYYNSIVSKLKDGKVYQNYYLMYIWIIILFVVGYASFFSVIEEKNTLNNVSRIILFLFLIFIAYFIFKNIYLYFSGYSINYNPLK